jgi:hypothetical protein
MKMHIYRVIKKGQHLGNLSSGDETGQVESILHAMNNSLLQCLVALKHFNEAQRYEETTKEEWFKQRDIRSQASDFARQQTPRWFDLAPEELLKLSVDEYEFLLNAGFKPVTSRMKKVVHAKSFLFAVNEYLNYYWSLKNTLADSPLKNRVLACGSDIGRSFDDVKALRDSQMHIDERIRGKVVRGRLAKDLTTNNAAPFVNHSGATVLIFNSFHGNDFTFTVEGDRLGKLEISELVLDELASNYQQLVDCFEWIGVPEILPALSHF